MRAEGNLVGEEVSVGDRVRVNRLMTQQYRLNTNDRYDLRQDEVFVVTRVMASTLSIRGPKDVRDTRYPHNTLQKDVSFSVDRMFLMFDDPNYVPPPPPRKLGVMPAAEDVDLPEGVPLIGIDHPGIQWLFDDMGKYATEQNYCSQYDALCVKLGIPGRPRDFTVRTTVKGIQLSTSVKARSQREANQIVKDALAEPENIQIDPDYAPAA
jgi:hypothetical protein